MSDAGIVDDEDPREFRSPLNLALDWVGFEAFKWLIFGHILFAIGLLLVLLADLDDGAIWVTPLFGLPLIWKGRGHRLGVKILVLLLGFTAAHWLAVKAATEIYAAPPSIVPGLVGGAVGGALSLLLCWVFGLLRHGAATLILALVGIVLLAGVGGLTVYLYLTTGDGGSTLLSGWVQMLKVYTPWQVAFAYVLAKVLRPDG